MKKLLAAGLLAVATLLTLANTGDAQVRYRWNAGYYRPYYYGPTYWYYQNRGVYVSPSTGYPTPYYTYRYQATPSPYYSNYYNPYLAYRPYFNYYVPNYYWTPPSSTYVPY